MYVVIVGCSKVGYHLAKAILATGHELVVVEKNPVRCDLICDELGSVAVRGDGSDEQVLKQAGAARADILIAVTDRDETNLVACQMAKHLFQVSQTMALIKAPKNESIFRILGVDVVINGTQLLLTNIEEEVPGRSLLHLMNLRVPNTELVSVSIPDDAGVVGKRLEEVELPPNSFISLVIKKTQAELPTDDLVLEGEDEVVAVTLTEEAQTLFEVLTGVE